VGDEEVTPLETALGYRLLPKEHYVGLFSFPNSLSFTSLSISNDKTPPESEYANSIEGR